MDPRVEYAARLVRWRDMAAECARLDNRLSTARGLVALAAVALAVTAFGAKWMSPAVLLLPLAAFLVLVILHERSASRQQHAARAIRLYERGARRLDGILTGEGSTGEQFRNGKHLYADDLDVFGRGSLFELVSVARTLPGEAMLAEWLTAPAFREEALARQAAVEELRDRVDLREDLAIEGEEIRSQVDPRKLAEWGAQPAFGVSRVVRWAMLALSLAVFVSAVGFFLQQWNLAPFLLLALPVIAVQAWMRPKVIAITPSLEARARDLRLMAGLLRRLEREPLKSHRLQQVEAKLRTGRMAASEEIARLVRLVERLEDGRNQFFALPAFFVLWTPQVALAIDEWKARCGAHIGEWIGAVAEFEALSSLASFAFEHPSTAFPELLDGPPVFEAEDLSHPLIPESRAVPNSLRLGDSPRLAIVSGSNMSGKSTLLRAVGLNTALAWAGAPVRAGRLRLSRLTVGASLRTVDSIQEGKSRFYAEITRIREILAGAQSGAAVLFLLDELLSGTNSHDRRVGAEGVLRGLLASGAIGLVTTHDLALVEIAETFGEHSANVHFEDSYVEGQIHFDYRMRPGPVQRSNAIALMRSIGLDV